MAFGTGTQSWNARMRSATQRRKYEEVDKVDYQVDLW